MSAIAPEPPATAPYRLRPATNGDAAWLYALHVACLREYVAQTWGWDEATQRRMFAERFDPRASQIVLVDGRAVGVVAVERRADGYFIGNIAIDPAWQGRGVGAAIIRDIQGAAAREGGLVRLRVLKVNPARRLYERLGFVVVGETATHYLLAAGERAGQP